MINEVLKKQIEKYNPENLSEIKNAIRETLQKIILSELGKTDFFNYVAFYGGTSLRIFHNLNRFSEDLDFTKYKESNINLLDYIKIIQPNIANYGIDCFIKTRDKNVETTVETHYLQFNLKDILSITYEEYSNNVNSNELVSIKIELEHSFIEDNETELLLLTYPSFSQIRIFNIETLFASKLLAIKNRKWKTRVKGRDYYDYLFYIEKDIDINMNFFKNGLIKLNVLKKNEDYTLNMLKESLVEIFSIVDFNDIQKDISPFIKNNDPYIQTLNKDIFLSSVSLLHTNNN